MFYLNKQGCMFYLNKQGCMFYLNEQGCMFYKFVKTNLNSASCRLIQFVFVL
jgi:hypothetical protein